MSTEKHSTTAVESSPNTEQPPTAPKKRKSLIKRLGNNITFFLASRFGHLLWLLAGYWTKIIIVGEENIEEFERQKAGYMWVVWHGRMLIPVFDRRKRNIIAMVSEHRDGELVARIVHKLGYRTARGSSTRGGRKAFMEMVKNLRDGSIAAMLPDGPKGPRHVFKPGTMLMAQRAQIPMLSITYGAHPAWTFRSWDRFLVPKPFSRSVILMGKPIYVGKDLKGAEFEALRKKIEARMIREVELCDAMARGEVAIPRSAASGDLT
jgi:lysophospholipid acyltransferase (LPLAT)-like uncharacterized protein